MSAEADRFRDEESQPYGLEDRTFRFAKAIRPFVKRLPNTIGHQEDVRQLIRSSGSVAANFIEAVEALSKKDYVYRIKICRKEAKGSGLWLRLLSAEEAALLTAERDELANESTELMNIFASISRRHQ